MATEPRLSAQTLKVLGVLVETPSNGLSGAQIARLTRLQSGTLYPILLRLENAGWLRSSWEVETPQALGRPRRRYYRVTAHGITSFETALREISPMIGRLVWS